MHILISAHTSRRIQGDAEGNGFYSNCNIAFICFKGVSFCSQQFKNGCRDLPQGRVSSGGHGYNLVQGQATFYGSVLPGQFFNLDRQTVAIVTHSYHNKKPKINWI